MISRPVIEAELRKRAALPRMFDRLFDKQRDYARDPARRKAALTTRRAGKTEGTASTLIDDARDFPGTNQLYLALTRKSAKQIIWPTIKKLVSAMTDVRANETDLTLVFENGSIIYISGAEDDTDVEKLRGLKLRRVVIDEAASFGMRLKYIIKDVLEPTLIDLRGTLEMVGTPGAACVGYFYDITNKPDTGWSVHRWSILHNPHIPHAQEELDAMRARDKTPRDDPTYLREWEGRWVRDDDSLVYKFEPARNTGGAPNDMAKRSHVLGIDLGWEDATAFNVASFAYDRPDVYMHDAIKRPKMTVSAIVDEIERYRKRYTFQKIVCDTAGIGKMVAEEMKTRYNLPIEPAEKADKLSIIELLNSDLVSGRVIYEPGHPAIDEMLVMQWNDRKTREDEAYPADASDASLYSYREAKHWAYTAPIDRPKAGTPERANLDADAEMDAEIERLKGENDRPFWM